MTSILDTFIEWLHARRAGCCCSLRFFGVASDIDCPLHGIDPRPTTRKHRGRRVPRLLRAGATA